MKECFYMPQCSFMWYWWAFTEAFLMFASFAKKHCLESSCLLLHNSSTNSTSKYLFRFLRFMCKCQAANQSSFMVLQNICFGFKGSCVSAKLPILFHYTSKYLFRFLMFTCKWQAANLFHDNSKYLFQFSMFTFKGQAANPVALVIQIFV